MMMTCARWSRILSITPVFEHVEGSSDEEHFDALCAAAWILRPNIVKTDLEEKLQTKPGPVCS